MNDHAMATVHSRKSFGNEWLQRLDFAVEYFPFLFALFRSSFDDFIDVACEITHQQLDDLSADTVIGGQSKTSHSCEAARHNGARVARRVGSVLNKSLPEAANGGRAQTYQCGGIVHGIALEIPAQCSGARRDSQAVVRRCVVIEPDRVIAQRRQTGVGGGGLVEACGRPGNADSSRSLWCRLIQGT